MQTQTKSTEPILAETGKQSPSALRTPLLIAVFLYLFVALFPLSFGHLEDHVDGHFTWALNQLCRSNYEFGRDVIFTYGPLGYLMWRPCAQIGTLVASFAVHTSVIFLSFLLAWKAASPRRALLFALMLLVPFAVVGSTECRLELFIALLSLSPLSFPARGTVLAMLLGFLAAGAPFAKFSLGISSMLQAALGALCWLIIYKKQAWKWIAGFAVSYAVTLAVLAVVFCGSLGGFAHWLEDSIGIVGAYSENLSLSSYLPQPLSAVTILACYCLGLLFLLHSKSSLSYPAALFVPVLLFGFKHSFARQDPPHSVFFIFYVLVALAYLILFARRKRETVAIAGFFLACVGVFSLWSPRARDAIGDYRTLALGTSGLTNLGSVLRWRQTTTSIEEANARCLSHYTLPPAVVEHIKSRKGSVDVIPFEVLYCPANSFTWNPNPIIQLYAAFTPSLDARSAAHFEGPGAPQFVIVHLPIDIDGRSTILANPYTWRALLSNYEPLTFDETKVIILSRRKIPRHENLSPVPGEVTMDVGQWIPVPASDRLIFGSVRLKRTFLGGLLKTLYQVPPVSIDLAYASGRYASYRLLPNIAEAGILLNAVPRDLNDIEELFHGRCMDPVVAFRVSTPQRGYFRKHVTLDWLKGSTPVEMLEQPSTSYDGTKSTDWTHYSVDGVGDEVVAGKSRVQVVLAADQLLRVSGWAVDRINACPARGLTLCVDGKVDVPAHYGIRRRDVAEHYGIAAYDKSGFSCTLNGASIEPGRHVVRIKIFSKDLGRYYEPDFSLIVHRQ